MSVQVAIDGPAGAGKSTIAKMAAKKLGYVYIDTGAMYRTIGLYMLKNGIDIYDEAAVVKAAERVDIAVEYSKGEQQLILNGKNVTGQIRTEEVSKAASAVSRYIPVRERLVNMQREMAQTEDVLMDGRDIGTVVLPFASVKIYLTASVEVRATRRWKEFIAKGENITLDEVKKDVEARDYADMHRAASPLKQADDAYLLDSSDMTIDEVVDTIVDAARKAEERE